MKYNVPVSSESKPRALPWIVRGVFVGGRGSSLPLLWIPLRRGIKSLAPDDCGDESVHPFTRHNLHWFRLDGTFAQASESIVLAYLPLLVLALGASRAQIGLMSALSSLSAALLLLPGASVVERWGHRKLICLMGGGGVARITLLLLALVPMAFSGPSAVHVAIVLVILRSAFANLSVPAWMSLTADIVPRICRGRYFSSRNMAMGVAGMVATFLAGQLITRTGAPFGYQLAIGVAFAIGMVSTLSFARIQESPDPTTASSTNHNSHASLLQHLKTQPEFLVFCAVTTLWNFSLGVAAPFFNVHLVQNLGASASIVGALSVIHTLAALPGQRLFGIWADRWGPRRLQLITGLFIPLIPWGWALARSLWYLVPVELVSGFLWAGYGLGHFNLLLILSPEDRRSRYTALYQLAVMVALAGGSAFGGLLVARGDLESVFIVSGIGRLGATLLFARWVHQPSFDIGSPNAYQRSRKRGFGTTS